MPSGYTADIYEGKEVKGTDFILKCARAFGAAVTMREEGLDVEIREVVYDDWHLERAKRSEEKLAIAKAMSHDEIEAMLESKYQLQLTSYEENIERRKAMRERYARTLFEVDQWQPPSAEHAKLKEFARSQLLESMAYDCGVDYFEPPTRQTVEEWKKTEIAYLKKDIIASKTRSDEQRAEVDKRNKWIRDLKESLKKQGGKG